MPRSQVDEQVVKMSFDNSNFDSNINTSINALNNLDNKLVSLNKENFASLTTNINNLANTFSIKGQIMLGVLTRLGSKIYDLGHKAFNSLFKGIKDGLGEYNLIIESTEAIYQNVKQSGSTLGDVMGALDELNDYSDKTIYNFAQMTRMIGMFASAGVGLKKSVSTIKGLANAAALVGANMQKAQIAWNAVSRAMSSGRFTNITWRSLELSGIAGKQFNKVITEVARNMKVKGKQTGKDIDGMIKKWGTLRETLREGWLTKDVFTEAMDILSGAMSNADLKKKGYTDKQINELRAIANAAEEAATKIKTFQQLLSTTAEAIGSGWAQSFRILIGDLEEAKRVYTRISNVLSDFIENNANIRNELFYKIVNGKDSGINKNWKTGKENFRQIIENMLAIVKTFLKSVKTGFLNIFPVDRIAAAARKVLDIVQNFTKAIVINEEEINSKDGIIHWDTSEIDKISDSIKDLIKFFRGLAAAVDLVWMAISQPMQEIISRVPFFTKFFEYLNKGIVSFTGGLGKFGDKITVVRDAAKEFNIFGAAVEYLFDNFDKLAESSPVINAIGKIFNFLKGTVLGLKGAFDELNISPLTTLFGIFKMVVVSLWNILNKVVGLIMTASSKIDWSWLDKPKEAIGNILKVFDEYGKGLLSFKEAVGKIGEIFSPIFSGLADFVKNIPFAKIFGGISSGLKTLFTFISNIVGKYFGNKGKTSDAVGKSLNSFSSINNEIERANVNVENLGNSVEKTADGVYRLIQPVESIESAAENVNESSKNTNKLFSGFANIFKNLDKVFDSISKKVILIGAGLGAGALGIATLAKRIQKIKILANLNNVLDAGVNVLKAYQRQIQAKTIMYIAIAVGILAGALVTLSFIPYDKLENGLSIFVGFLGTIALMIPPVVNAITKLVNAINGKAIPALTQYDVLNNLVNTFGQLGKKLARGLNARMFGKAFRDMAIAILILVAAMIALKIAFKDPNDIVMPLRIITYMLIAMTVAVGVLTGLIEGFNNSVKDLKPSVGIFRTFFALAGVAKVIMSMALAMLALAGALVIISKIEPEKLLVSSIALLAILGALGGLAALLTALARSSNHSKVKVVVGSMAAVLLSVALIVAAFSKIEDPVQLGITIAGLIAIFASFGGLLMILGHLKPPSNINGLNGIIGTITGSLIAITASIGALVYFINKAENTNAWWQALTSLGSMMLLFSATVAGMLLSTKFIKDPTVWTKLQTTIAIASGAMLAIAGSIALIANVPPIPTSALVLFGMIALVIESIMAVAIVMSTVKGGLLSSGFIRTIRAVAIAVSAVATSIGILAAGIGIAAAGISKLDFSSRTVKEIVDNIVERMSGIGEAIITALPRINQIFTNIGFALANVMTSFVKSFVEGITNLSGEYVIIAEKIVNLIIDLASKIVDIIYERKDEIAAIVYKAITAIAAIIQSVINIIFQKKNGLSGDFNMPDTGMIAKIIGVIALLPMAATAFKVIYTIASWCGKIVGNVLIPIFKKFIANSTIGVGQLALKFAVVAAAIAATIFVLNQAYHAYKQLKGEEDAYHNASIQTWGDAVKNITNVDFLLQSFKYGLTLLGRILIQSVMAPIRIIIGLVMGLAWIIAKPIMTIIAQVTNGIAAIQDLLGNHEAANELRRIRGEAEATVDALGSGSIAAFKDSFNGIKNVGDFELGGNEWQYYDQGKTNAKNYTDGVTDGLSDYPDSVNGVLAQGDSEIQNGICLRWDMHSPSKVMERMYKNIPAGAEKGVESGMGTFMECIEEYNDEVENAFENAFDSQEAIVEKSGKSVEKGLNDNVNMYSDYIDKTKEEYEDSCKAFHKSLENNIAVEEKIIKKGKKKLKNVSIGVDTVRVSQLGGVGATTNQSGAKESEKSSNGLPTDKYIQLKNETADITSYVNALKNATKSCDEAIQQSTENFVNNSELVLEKANALRNTTISAYNVEKQQWQKIKLDTRMIDLIDEQKTALVGMSKAEAATYLASLAADRGIENSKQEAYLAVNALWSNQVNQEKLALKSVEKFQNATSASLEQYVGEAGAANSLVLNNYLGAQNEMLAIARDHSNELVGLNKKQAQQKLYDEAKARGMNDEDAKIHSESLVKIMFAQKKSMKKLNEDAIIAGIKQGETEEKEYQDRLQHETYMLQQALEERIKKSEYASKMMASGKFDVSTFRSYMSEVNNTYNNAVKAYNAQTDKIRKELEKKGRIDSKTWKKQWDDAINNINKQKSKKRGTFMGALDSFKNAVKNGLSNALNLDSWNNNFKIPTTTGNGKDKDKPVNQAKDLKKDLENQRADLTPTFDLDKLASDANKASDIVMSSLMAAQNASIGDYINSDSELNPFMKDRWQNVYNFTQNNYSPKALSRIDIYRQTQRQLSMSRGF